MLNYSNSYSSTQKFCTQSLIRFRKKDSITILIRNRTDIPIFRISEMRNQSRTPKLSDTQKVPLVIKLMKNSSISRIIEKDNDETMRSQSVKLSVDISETSNHSLVSAGSSNILTIYLK